jgi:hypothetical protein
MYKTLDLFATQNYGKNIFIIITYNTVQCTAILKENFFRPTYCNCAKNPKKETCAKKPQDEICFRVEKITISKK